jgi:hypothetical protein
MSLLKRMLQAIGRGTTVVANATEQLILFVLSALTSAVCTLARRAIGSVYDER